MESGWGITDVGASASSKPDHPLALLKGIEQADVGVRLRGKHRGWLKLRTLGPLSNLTMRGDAPLPCTGRHGVILCGTWAWVALDSGTVAWGWGHGVSSESPGPSLPQVSTHWQPDGPTPPLAEQRSWRHQRPLGTDIWGSCSKQASLPPNPLTVAPMHQ